MPKLDWLFGDPFAIGLMMLFAALPYIYFKCKGWL
jgi:magnesium transporter